jgi:transcriptional regulator with GAF, ATPase, and Fis domain
MTVLSAAAAPKNGAAIHQGMRSTVQRFSLLLLDVWREVCRHIEIGDSVERVAPLLASRLPADLLLVRHLDVPRSHLETVATGFCHPETVSLRLKTECPQADLDKIVRWTREDRVMRAPAEDVNRDLPGLLPAGLEGEVLVGPLTAGEGPAGVLIFARHAEPGFTAEHEDLAKALLEPFSVAMENDRRVRELTALREAAEADNRSLLSRLGRHDISDSIVGADTGLRPVMEQIELVARADAPVLILGETGSGKEVVARAIHTRSPRAGKPFLRVNCGAIPPELIDSELFGHERGSFTGAVNVRKGWFERADGGTLFLDECGELPLAAQVRLLRILQDGSFERVGGERQLAVDVRIMAATHRDVHEMVEGGRFRKDLWYRIAVFPIHLPPLRDRRDDIPALASHFALRAAKRLGTAPLVPTPEQMALLVSYPWPGNVRELAAVIERAAILGNGRSLEVAQALGGIALRTPPPGDVVVGVDRGPVRAELQTLDAVMAGHIEAALARTRGRIEGPDGAARVLGINPHTLRARMRKLGVKWQRFRPSFRPAPEPSHT